jgi:hypothetical protein
MCEWRRRKDAEAAAQARAREAAADRRRRADEHTARLRDQLEAAEARGFWIAGRDRARYEPGLGHGPDLTLTEFGSLEASAPCWLTPVDWERFRERLRAAGGSVGELPQHANRLIPSTYLFVPLRSFTFSVSARDLNAEGLSRLARVMAEGLAELWREAQSRVAR